MFKLLVLFVLVAVSSARPGIYESSPLVYSSPIHSLQNVGYVKSIPTAISHQSSSLVHGSAHVVEPIVSPVLKSYSTPVLHHSYAAPVAYAAPRLSYAASPLHYGGSHLAYASNRVW